MEVIEIDSIFSEEDFSFITNQFENSTFKDNKGWESGIKHFSNPVKIHQLKDRDTIELINNNIKKVDIPPLNKNVIKACLFYKWEPGCYIPWHNDTDYSAGLTIYLNDKWNYRNGGLFLYEDNNEIKTIVPQRNKGVLQIGGVPHSTTMVSKFSEPRKTIQIFFDKFNEIDNYII